ncbi:MAG: YaiI/YqxD family protein [Epulopiscium sp.]|nr:YaiI/YqxD family protein [Candidatus Epulonipiscium sp.]
MRIIVDGDSCPVIGIIDEIAKSYDLDVILFCSYCHVPKERLNIEYCIVDSEPQAVDLAIINCIKEQDVIVTQDYGLASLILSKGAKAISPKGNIYTNEEIDILLFNRYINSEIRRSGGRTKGPNKRTKKDDEKFKRNLKKLIEIKL